MDLRIRILTSCRCIGQAELGIISCHRGQRVDDAVLAAPEVYELWRASIPTSARLSDSTRARCDLLVIGSHHNENSQSPRPVISSGVLEDGK